MEYSTQTVSSLIQEKHIMLDKIKTIKDKAIKDHTVKDHTIKDHELIAGLRRLKEELHILKEEIRSNRSSDPQKTDEIEKNIHFLSKYLLQEAESGRGLIRRADEIPDKEKHYDRNRLMPVESLPQSPELAVESGWDGSVGAACHQFTSPDRSHSEVIFDHCGHIVTAPEDYGTYNFTDSRQDSVGHFYQDVLPWLLWGNDETDSTDMRQRLKALVIYGGLEALPTRSELKSVR